VVLGFDDRIGFEHIYWDQASLLVQVDGLEFVNAGCHPVVASTGPICDISLPRVSGTKDRLKRLTLRRRKRAS
jgi:hypothetical protein